MTQQSYTASDTWVVPAGVTTLTHLVKVAGGGAGGTGDSTNSSSAGGGGAGGVVHETSVTVVPGETLTITVGAGGTAPGSLGNGGDGGATTVTGSVSGALGTTAVGGGGGSRRAPSSGSPNGEGNAGGSGGGGGSYSAGSYHPAGGAGTGGQGNNGGAGHGNATNLNRNAGGGGGAGAVGGAATSVIGGAGGVGVDLSATVGTGVGASGWFGGGGGGGTRGGATQAAGGTGGGGGGNAGVTSAAAVAGTAGTGGGGGGGSSTTGNLQPGANGGSGAVVIVYTAPAPPDVPTTLSATPGTTTIDFDWVAPVAGDAPTGYDVRLDGGTPVDVGLVLTYEFTGLTPDTAYTLEVRSYNAAGDSSWVSLGADTLPAGPSVAYAAKIRIGSHVWEIEFDDPADLDSPEILAGATFNWTAPDNVGWPPPMATVPRDVCQLRVRCPDAADVEDVRRGDIVRFKFTPEGYDYAAPLVDFAGIITADPKITDDRGAGVILQVTASDYTVILTNWTLELSGVVAENGDTMEFALQTVSTFMDDVNANPIVYVPGAFGDVTVGAVDPDSKLTGTLGADLSYSGLVTTMKIFTDLGVVPVPQYDDDGDLDPVQPFRVVETGRAGEVFDTPAAIDAAIVPNSSVEWRRDYLPTYVEVTDGTGSFWQGMDLAEPEPTDYAHEVLLRLSGGAMTFGTPFNFQGLGNQIPETEPWGLYSFLVLGYRNPEACRDWFIYPERVRQYVTIENVELVKNPSGTDTVAGMLKGATLVVGPRGRWTVQAGLRNHHFGTP